MNPSTIPRELTVVNRWVCWGERQGRAKVPLSPLGGNAKSNDPRTWGTFRQAADVIQSGRSDVQGLGFVLSGSDYWALDLDHVIDPAGLLLPAAQELLDRLPASYTERSPSGDGLHVIFRGRRPDCLGRTTAKDLFGPGTALEVFGGSSARYLTMTGQWWQGRQREIVPCSPEGLQILQNCFPTVRDVAVHGEPNGERGNAETRKGLNRTVTPPTQDDLEHERPRVAVALQSISPDDYHDWILVGACLRNTFPSGEARALWERWSAGSPKAAQTDFDRFWRSLEGHTGPKATLASLYHLADLADRGWRHRDPQALQRGGRVDVREAFEELPDGGPQAIPQEPLILSGEAFLEGGFVPEWLLHGLLPTRGWAQIYGQPGCGKTPVALSLACSVAAGAARWLDRWDIDRPGAVLYMVGEGASGIRARTEAQRRHTVQQGCADPLPNLYFTARPGALSAAGDVALWVRHCQAVCPDGIQLVIVDTQNANFGPGDENSTEDMTRFRHAVEEMSRQLGALVLTVHHTGLQDTSRARGSSVQLGSLETQIHVGLDEIKVTIRATRVKDGETPDPVIATLRQIELAKDNRGRAVTAVYLQDGAPDVLELLDRPDPTPSIDELLERFLKALLALPGGARQAGVAKLCGIPRGRLSQQVLEAAKLERLVKVLPGRRSGMPPQYRLTQAGLRRARGEDPGPRRAPDQDDILDLF